MNNLIALKKVLGRLSLSVLIVLLFVVTGYCETVSPKALFVDPPFADPNEMTDMGEEWSARMVKHPDNIDADLYVVLSYQMMDVWKPWVDSFAWQNKMDIYMQDGVDGTSAGALRRKEADVACYCGSPKSSDRMPGIKFHTVGIVPVAFFVNASNPLSDISLETAMKVFRGELNNWADLGGEMMSIVPVARSHCKKRRGRWRPLNNMDNLSPSAIKVGSIEDALSFVATTSGSISYEILPLVAPLVEQGKIKVLSVNGINPFDLKMLAEGKYPMYRTYTFTTWEGDSPEESKASALVKVLKEKTAENAEKIYTVPASDLLRYGWKFHGEELIGEPPS